MTKIVKKKHEKTHQKLVSLCVFMFSIPEHIAHKMVRNSNYVLKKTLTNVNSGLIKQKTRKIATFWDQNS